MTMAEPRYLDSSGRMIGLVYAAGWVASCHVDRCSWEQQGRDPEDLDMALSAHLHHVHPGHVADRVTVP